MINYILKILRKKKYFSGPYKEWSVASKNSTGYNSDEIFNKVKSSLLLIKKIKKGYERDSVIIFEEDHDNELLDLINSLSNKENTKINILDFGGSLGSLYFRHKKYIKHVFCWSIIEQPKYVEEGISNFQNSELKFFYNIKALNENYKPDILIISSVLQYIENYREILDDLIKLNPKYILILKTPLNNKPNNEIYIQKPAKHIYKSNYPSWVFSNDNVLKIIEKKYKLIKKKLNKPEVYGIDYLDLYFKNKDF